MPRLIKALAEFLGFIGDEEEDLLKRYEDQTALIEQLTETVERLQAELDAHNESG